MKSYRIAFIPIVRSTFDVPFAEEMIRQAREHLLTAGYDLVEPAQPISDLEAAKSLARDFSSEAIDLTLIYQATFADSTMAVALAEASSAPVFLWAVPEPWTGDRLRLNSLCGINLTGHALNLRHLRYEFAYGLPGDEAVLRKINTQAAAGQLRRRLKQARLGLIGEHPSGFDSCHLEESKLLDVFGVKVERIELAEVFSRARAMPDVILDQTRLMLDDRLNNLATLEQKPLKNSLSVYNALKEIAVEKKLDGMAVRCWPDFFVEMDCAACGAMSMLSDGFGNINPIPCGCEADINGTLTQLILQWLGNKPAFGTDMVGVDVENDRVALWHCGLAPMSMADPNVQAKGSIHSNRRKPLVLDFPLKPGVVTVARISQSSGSLRLVLGRGQMLAEPKPFSGTAGILKLDCQASRFLELLMREGLEHHVSIIYGDYLQELRAFAEMIQLPLLSIG
jgi:L-fucose isomerase-like protein